MDNNVGPVTPTGLALTATTGGFLVSWNNDSEATGYKIFWSTSSIVNENSNMIEVNSNSFLHTNLTNRKTYYYRIAAYNDAGMSPLSSTVSMKYINVISNDEANSVQNIINDMKLSHEGFPHGVPTSYDWQSKPVVHDTTPPSGYFAMTLWGQFYEDVDGNKATNTRVHIRNLKVYYLNNQDNKWYPLQNINPIIDGNWFYESFNPGTSFDSDIKYETEGVSATAGNGYCFHYWIKDRASITPQNIAGIYTTCEARLIVADNNLIDDREKARYVLNMGADWWMQTSGSGNTGIGMGRFKYVRTGWQSFNFCTLSESDINKSPPPID